MTFNDLCAYSKCQNLSIKCARKKVSFVCEMQKNFLNNDQKSHLTTSFLSILGRKAIPIFCIAFDNVYCTYILLLKTLGQRLRISFQHFSIFYMKRFLVIKKLNLNFGPNFLSKGNCIQKFSKHRWIILSQYVDSS